MWLNFAFVNMSLHASDNRDSTLQSHPGEGLTGRRLLFIICPGWQIATKLWLSLFVSEALLEYDHGFIYRVSVVALVLRQQTWSAETQSNVQKVQSIYSSGPPRKDCAVPVLRDFISPTCLFNITLLFYFCFWDMVSSWKPDWPQQTQFPTLASRVLNYSPNWCEFRYF